MSLLPITEAEHGVESALAYASARNFTGKPIYRRERCYLHAAAAHALTRAVALAAGQGYRLKIFDAFTPLSHHGSLEVSPAVQAHRSLLLGIMTAAGWDFYRNEWWHYQLFNARANYPLFSDSALPVGMMPK